MILVKTRTGEIARLENGKYLDIKTNQALAITPEQIIETIKVGFTLWQIIKQFWSLIEKLFTKSKA